MVLKANDRRTSCPCHDEFRAPRSDYIRQVALENNCNKHLGEMGASSSLDHGSKFRSLSLKAFESADTLNHSLVWLWVSDRGLPCHEFEPSTAKDPPCRAAMHVKSVES
ncbi:hypothetical protein TNCV_1119331 [Trichonephila clavipes]|uniref:Uncharacterized protein n=1 Tax=Trichonephila clavipes TaxID=2585209 RepID=A0A8X6SVC5_TRICX|nr:hypothetical protein TNCV_1119331 [Trichonephila clavipes]